MLFCPHKLLMWCFIEKSYFLWLWKRHCGFVITLMKISAKSMFKSQSLLSVTWIHMNKQIWHVSELSLTCKVSDSAFFALFLLNSAPFWCLFSLGLSDQVFFIHPSKKCDVLIWSKNEWHACSLKKKHVLCDSVSSDSALLASPWQTAVSCKFVFTCSHWTLFFNEKQSEVVCCFAAKRSWHAFSLKNHVLCACFCNESVTLASLWPKSAQRRCLFSLGATCHLFGFKWNI